jgi:hypothetical protein
MRFLYQKRYHRGWGLHIKGGKHLEPKFKKNGIIIIAIILLAGMSLVTIYHFFETKIESQQVVIQNDADTNVGTISSVSKSTAILIICIGFLALLSRRRT